MSRVNLKSPAFPKHPSVFSLINAIWTDEKKNRLRIETVKALIIVKTHFENLSCAEFYDRVPIRPVFPGIVPFFIQMSRANLKSPGFPKYPSVLSLINAIWTDEKKTDLESRQ
jgi:hypothetical protein